MTTLNQIIIYLGPAFVVLALILLMLFAVFRWIVARQEQIKLSTAFSSVQKELAHSKEASTALNEQIQRLGSQASITEFRDETIYLITAKHEIELAGELNTYGLVRSENYAIKPFITNQRMEGLQVDDYITCVRGELVKVGKKPSDAVSDQNKEAVSEPVEPREIELETVKDQAWTDQGMVLGASIDQTVMFDKASNKPENYDEMYAGIPYLKALTGNDQGAIYYLMFGRASIGRGESCNFAIKDGSSSKIHCEILYENHNFVLKDNQSTNGTFCNGAQIQEVALNFGDIIKVGNTEMIFTCEGFELKENNPVKAMSLFEKCLQREPDFVIALKHLAFLMERDIARQKNAKPLWDRIKKLESST
jgi:hypothetical protein